MSKQLEKRKERAIRLGLHNDDGSCPECGASVDNIYVQFVDRWSESVRGAYCSKCNHSFNEKEAEAILDYSWHLDEGFPEGCTYYDRRTKNKEERCVRFFDRIVNGVKVNYKQECCEDKCPLDKEKFKIDWSEYENV